MSVMRLWSKVKSTKMLFFFSSFCILCVSTPDSQSSVKENKLNIFKTNKSEKILYCLMCKNTVLMMLNFLNALTLNVKNKVCVISVLYRMSAFC